MPTRPKVAERFAGFDALRIFAAIAVVGTHSYELTGYGTTKPLLYAGRGLFTLGTVGVGVFFVTSGFLVAMSWERSPSLVVFARHRAQRIWPALVVLVVVLVLVLGPLMTTLSVGEYFRSPLTHHFAWKNILLVLGPEYFLPAVFSGQPSSQVDGSLWTLQYEVYGYFALAVLGWFGVLRRPWVVGCLLSAVLLLHRLGVSNTENGYQFFYRPMSVRGLLGFGAWFLAGAFLATVRSSLSPRLLSLIGSAALVSAFLVSEPALVIAGLASLTVGLGMTNWRACAALHRLGDPSYGIYIFSFPVQQVLYQTGAARTPGAMFAFAAPISIAIGYLSWHAVERRALRKGRRG